MIYREDTLQIQGVSESCHDYFGIPAQIVFGNSANTTDFTIDSIAPAIADVSNRKDLMSPQGLVCYIDSTYVQRNFLIDEEDEEDSENGYGGVTAKESDDEEGEDNEQHHDQEYITPGKNKLKKYRVAQVKVNLVSE